MLPSFVLSLREGLEGALIIGIVLGALRKTNRSEYTPVVWAGALSAAILSLLAALVLTSIGASLEGRAEQIFEGATMLLAAGVLSWMIFWMVRQSRSIKNELESGVQRAALAAGRKPLFLLAFLAVLREGVELALFLTAAVYASDRQMTALGSLVGLAVAAFLGWLLFATSLRLDLRRFFQVTGILLILFAAGLVAHSVHEFNEVGWIPVMVEHVWDVGFLLNENSALGEVIKALFGYNANPSFTEVLAYLAYFTAILIGMKWKTTPPATVQKA